MASAKSNYHAVYSVLLCCFTTNIARMLIAMSAPGFPVVPRAQKKNEIEHMPVRFVDLVCTSQKRSNPKKVVFDHATATAEGPPPLRH